MWSAIDQPTTGLVWQSIMATRHSQPCRVRAPRQLRRMNEIGYGFSASTRE